MILKILLIIIYIMVIKIIIQFIPLLYSMFTEKYDKPFMHRYNCPYCHRHNELMVKTESVFFWSRYFLSMVCLMVISLITFIIPSKHLSFMKIILEYALYVGLFIGLLFGFVGFIAHIECKRKNIDKINKFILKIANILFNVRKFKCDYCQLEHYEITGF